MTAWEPGGGSFCPTLLSTLGGFDHKLSKSSLPLIAMKYLLTDLPCDCWSWTQSRSHRWQIYEVKSATVFRGRISFKGDYILRVYNINLLYLLHLKALQSCLKWIYLQNCFQSCSFTPYILIQSKMNEHTIPMKIFKKQGPYINSFSSTVWCDRPSLEPLLSCYDFQKHLLSMKIITYKKSAR